MALTIHQNAQGPSVTFGGGFAHLLSAIKRHNLTLQFAAYEGGNAFAAVAGSGGFSELWVSMTVLWSRALTALAGGASVLSVVGATAQDAIVAFPDLAVVVGVTVLVILGAIVRLCIAGPDTSRPVAAAIAVLEGVLAVAALSVMALALVADASFICQSAAAFVVGSALLHQARRHPRFLKLGGLALAAGGALLAAHGATDEGSVLLSVMTVLTGVYVAIASLLTYEGGMFVSKAEVAKSNGFDLAMAALFDRPISAINAVSRATLLVPVLTVDRDMGPFSLSMWARLPWRVATAAIALVSGAWVFALANLLWGMGDIAIGSLDWAEQDNG